MNVRKMLVAVGLMAISWCAAAEPIFLDFEDKTSNNPLGNYHGFTFTGSNFITTGWYANANMDGKMALIATNVDIVRQDKTTFDFNGFLAKSSGQGSDAFYLTVQGFLAGEKIYQESLQIPAYGANSMVSLSVNFVGIDKLIFVSGPKPGDDNRSELYNFYLDNMAFNGAAVGPVPEPSTYAMMAAGLGMIGMIVRRRKSIASK